MILGIEPVTGQRFEVLNQLLDVVERMRTVGVAGHLRLLPGSELRISLRQEPVGFFLKARDLIGDVDIVLAGKMPQFCDLSFQLLDGLLEIKIRMHGFPLLA